MFQTCTGDSVESNPFIVAPLTNPGRTVQLSAYDPRHYSINYVGSNIQESPTMVGRNIKNFLPPSAARMYPQKGNLRLRVRFDAPITSRRVLPPRVTALTNPWLPVPVINFASVILCHPADVKLESNAQTRLFSCGKMVPEKDHVSCLTKPV